MKNLIYLIFSLGIMSSTGLEHLIGKKISNVTTIMGDSVKLKEGDSIYHIEPKSFVNNYFGVPYNYLLIETNNDSNIKSITIYFNEIIDRSFYNDFILDYGQPNTVQVIENINIISKKSKNKVGEFIMESGKKFLRTKEGTFEENPLYIIWNKENYQIKILFKYSLNTTEITFRVPTNTF